MTNYNAYNTVSKVKTAARNDAFEIIRNALIDVLGPDAVSVVGSNTVAFTVGTKEVDGEDVEVTAILKPTVKDYAERQTPSGKVFEAYNRAEAEEIYTLQLEEKARVKALKEADKG